MFIKILFNYQGERTQGECVVRANEPDTIGIINQLQWATKTPTSRRLGIYAFQLQNPNLYQYFGFCFHQSCTRQSSFAISGFNQFNFSETNCEKVLFFANRDHLQALKVRDLKLVCPSQLRGLTDRKIKVRI